MFLPELQEIEAGDHLISFRQTGDGEALLFVHGMGCGSINWESQYDWFSSRYLTIGWDAPGYGQSSNFHTDLPSVADYIMALASFLDALEIKKVHLVGHSYGGIIVAGFYRSYPERVLSMTLAQPVIGGGIQRPKDREKEIRKRFELVQKLGMEKYAAMHVPKSCSPEVPPDILEKGISLTAKIPQAGYLKQFRSLKHANIFEWTRKPDIPALIVSGEFDTTADKQVIKRIAKQISGIQEEVIPDIGHMIYLEHPNRFNELLEKFLKDCGEKC